MLDFMTGESDPSARQKRTQAVLGEMARERRTLSAHQPQRCCTPHARLRHNMARRFVSAAQPTFTDQNDDDSLAPLFLLTRVRLPLQPSRVGRGKPQRRGRLGCETA